MAPGVDLRSALPRRSLRLYGFVQVEQEYTAETQRDLGRNQTLE